MKAENRSVQFPDYVVSCIAAKCISYVAEKDFKLCITDIDENLLQEFLDETADVSDDFSLRTLRNDARYFFSDAFFRFSRTHSDSISVTVSGTIDNIKVSEDGNWQ